MSTKTEICRHCNNTGFYVYEGAEKIPCVCEKTPINPTDRVRAHWANATRPSKILSSQFTRREKLTITLPPMGQKSAPVTRLTMPERRAK